MGFDKSTSSTTTNPSPLKGHFYKSKSDVVILSWALNFKLLCLFTNQMNRDTFLFIYFLYV